MQIALSSEQSISARSIEPAVRYATDSSAQVCEVIAAILSLMSPNSPMFRPKALRSIARSIDIWMSRLHAPTELVARESLPTLSTSIATRKPRPGSPSTFSAGTRTSSKKSEVVEEPRIPSLCSSGPLRTPWPRSTRKAVSRGLWPSPGALVRAKTVNRSAKAPLVVQILEPFSV